MFCYFQIHKSQGFAQHKTQGFVKSKTLGFVLLFDKFTKPRIFWQTVGSVNKTNGFDNKFNKTLGFVFKTQGFVPNYIIIRKLSKTLGFATKPWV